MTSLVLGPVLRYVDDTRATVWVETDAACVVEVLGCSARTFQVGGHHYALVPVLGLRPGVATPYDVRLDGERVWPTGDATSRIMTVPSGDDASLRLLFGSCRFGSTEDPKHSNALGTDALEACARQLMASPDQDWPDALLMLGDQIYADQTTPQVQRELAERRDLGRPPGTEVADFEEYTCLYRHAWGDPEIRWLLSTMPTMMIFDDHDVRDDWNTSRQWRAEMARTSWWRERLLGGLVSYWIYQHIGNLSPDELEADETYRKVVEAGRSGDALPVLREFAARADTEIDGVKGMRWSYRRDLGPARLLILDTRGGRILETAERAMLSGPDFEWVRREADSDREHLVLATSLPWLLPPAVHHAQSWNEAACSRGRWTGLAEKVRQAGDLEHWAAFRSSFDRFAGLIHDVARDRAPSTISVLSGDVHHSYFADAEYPDDVRSRVVQLTCSPLHNPAPRFVRGPLRAAWSGRLTRVLRRLADRAGVEPPPVRWSKSAGPYFGNTVGVLELHGRHAEAALREAGGDHALTTICQQTLA